MIKGKNLLVYDVLFKVIIRSKTLKSVRSKYMYGT